MAQSPYNHIIFVTDITPGDFNSGTIEGGFQDADLPYFLSWYKNESGSISPYNNGLKTPISPYSHTVFLNDNNPTYLICNNRKLKKLGWKPKKFKNSMNYFY